ncbi:MAG: LacI family transcriptional regulator [Chloroflexi bacterium]|nr:LacI family transcriptional regulator [Chloroflexota bacterium]MCC6893153.1 LacI family DNA-binding transcriptional regulator [Anaerolineae bacterium]
MTSIKAVAKKAGVSIATVSRVLNGTKFVSPDIRANVLKVVEELNYKPSLPARNLRRQQTQTIGVLVPHLNDFYFGNLAFALEKILSSRGYSPMFASTESDTSKETICVDNLIQHRVQGTILVPALPVHGSIENVQRLMDSNIAVVLVDRGIRSLKVNQIISNNFQGGYDGARHLIELGHKHIGMLDSGTDALLPKFGPGSERISGVRQAMADAGLEFDIRNCIFSDEQNQSKAGYQGTFTLLRQSPEITAIFALTDASAVGALRAAYELGLSVPRDLSVMGFDDIPLASHVVPRLTTLAQPPDQIAQAAVDLLLRQFDEPSAPFQTITVGTQLIPRESTAPPRTQ